jgi:hypothetical protein
LRCFELIFDNRLFFVCVDLVILLGVARDLFANRRAHTVCLYALPLLIVAQSLAIYLWRGQPWWRLRITGALLG